ncbi:MAG: hypothetical protein ING77_06760 [Rhodocyclaceae bacterium]|nr:hypothetical protein [Rhodocyclaceae bacterium]MCE2978707.1 hypothetical protein [Betaproteobacteria bacterium]MCA3073331.1 hypothetical protein [Rhodocyclaceae bacterium]MCA3091371.1 hypothetical protein [Rhodocyclaceae bacterium]MCA3094180.1 hypothetical protein [Rhodocyclaceae bacterium]
MSGEDAACHCSAGTAIWKWAGKPVMEVTDRHAYIRQHGEDMPEIREWKWPTASLTPA